MSGGTSADVIEISDSESVDGVEYIPSVKRRKSAASDSDDDIVWVEEESDQEPDMECAYWDQDCRLLALRPTTSHLHGYHLMPTCSREPPPVEDVQTEPKYALAQSLTDAESLASLKRNWVNHNSCCDSNVEIITQPWRVCVINSLLEDASVLDNVRCQFDELSWNRRALDLYEFYQSEDLNKLVSVRRNKHFEECYKFLCGDLKDWVSKFMDMELTEVSASCTFYSHSDFLLVHDDKLGNRAVAFVLYLTDDEGWRPEWNGALELLSQDDYGPSFKGARQILPRNNQLVLFPVGNHSTHQVTEVTTKNKCRLTINGWFHTATPPSDDVPTLKTQRTGLRSLTTLGSLIDKEARDLLDWIKPVYLGDDATADIQEYMEEYSEIALDRFLLQSVYDRVLLALSSPDVQWTHQGPLNRRNFETLVETDLPECLDSFVRVFRSQNFFKLLKKYTDLDLDRMRYEVQRWQPGSYNMLADETERHDEPRLDAMFYIIDSRTSEREHMPASNDSGSSTDDFASSKQSEGGGIIGGRVSYVTLDEEVQNALVTLQPSDNTLNIVFGDTANFTSLVSKENKNKVYYIFAASYFEKCENICISDDDD